MTEPIGDEPQTEMDRLILEILKPIMVSLMHCDFYDDPNDHYFDAYFNRDHGITHEGTHTHILCIDANGDELWIYVRVSHLGHPRTGRNTDPDFTFAFADPEFLDKVHGKLHEILYGDECE